MSGLGGRIDGNEAADGHLVSLNLVVEDSVISYLHGILKRKLDDRVIVDVGGVGYDVFLPQFVMRSIDDRSEGEPIEFEIYYHVTERQLRPLLIGFNNDHEKRFFEKFISVEDIGPQKAAKALIFSVSTIARAIESENVGLLRQMPGIGERTAKKMIATLRGRVTEEALLQDEGFEEPPRVEAGAPSELREDVVAVLVGLGYRRSEAIAKVEAAMQRNAGVSDTEELIREVYRGESGTAQ